jgi:hypothetical protein
MCPCNRINDEISFKSIKKGFWVINLEDRSPQDIVERWNEFSKLVELDKEDFA